MKTTLNEIKNELIEAFNNGELIDYISDNAIEIRKDDDGDLSQIIFTLGGPNIFLDFEERSGVVCGFKSISDEGTFSAIPLALWSDIRECLEDFFAEGGM